MNGHDSAMTEVALPLLIGILVVDAVLYVVREKVFQFDRRAKPEAYLGEFPPNNASGISM